MRRALGAAAALTAAAGCGSPAGPTTGSLRADITGLPPGSPALVVVAGPGSTADTLTASGTLSELEPGSYTITGSVVTAGTDDWQPQPGSQTVAVAAGRESSVTVAYLATTGSISLSVTGVPSGVAAALTITGPGLDTSLTAGSELTGLALGQYQLTAQSVDDGSFSYVPDLAVQTVTVAGGQVSSAAVNYSNAGPIGLNLKLETAYLVQAIQRFADFSRSPLVAGRDALLRVFLTANVANSLTPQVVIRLYQDSVIVDSVTLVATAAGVPLAADEGQLDLSYNYLIPGSEVGPGLGFSAQIVPDPAVSETTLADNSYPAAGGLREPAVAQLPPLALRFVPVHQDSTGLTGQVDFATIPNFTAELERWYPTSSVDPDLHATYTTSAPPLSSNDANGAWGQVLSEIRLLRLNEGSSRYYYGVVKVGYSSGVAGLGYVPSQPNSGSKAAIGWDRNRVGWVTAHEVGHNHGRNHSPGCGAQGVDPGYPYSDGSIGAFGYDHRTMTVVGPGGTFDFMSYCNQNWVSDYTWDAMWQWRLAESGQSSSARAAATTVLALWGRITASGPVLEPAFVLQGAPVLPPTGSTGPNRIVALAGDGTELLSFDFTGDLVADLPQPERHFAFLVPVDSVLLGRIDRLVLSGAGGSAVRSAPARAGGPQGLRNASAVALSRVSGSEMRLDWDGAVAPMIMVRERDTGEIIALARRGRSRFPTTAAEVELLISDGVRSVTLARRP